MACITNPKTGKPYCGKEKLYQKPFKDIEDAMAHPERPLCHKCRLKTDLPLRSKEEREAIKKKQDSKSFYRVLHIIGQSAFFTNVRGENSPLKTKDHALEEAQELDKKGLRAWVVDTRTDKIVFKSQAKKDFDKEQKKSKK